MYTRDILGDHRRSHCRPKGTESKVPQSQQLLTPRIAYQVMAGILLAFHSLIDGIKGCECGIAWVGNVKQKISALRCFGCGGCGGGSDGGIGIVTGIGGMETCAEVEPVGGFVCLGHMSQFQTC
jgi:hypothetical protein